MLREVFGWILGAIIGFYGLGPFIAICAAAVVGMYFGFPRSTDFRKRRLIGPLVSLPAIWLLVGVAGIVFSRTHPELLTTFEFLFPSGLSVLIAGIFVWRLKGARLFISAYALVNLCVTLFISFFAGMSITGSWP